LAIVNIFIYNMQLQHFIQDKKMALHGPSIVQPFVNINLYQCTLILNDDLYFCTAWYENESEMFEQTKKKRGGKKGADCQTSSEHFDTFV